MTAANPATDSGLIPVLDSALGWLLDLPRDLSLVMFAVITASMMILVRRYVTNQDLLRRCIADLRQLKRLLVQARSIGDKPSQSRLRRTMGQIKGKQFSADLRVLVTVIIPVGALAVWASERLEYLPPVKGEDLAIRAYYPLSSVDRLTHAVPSPGLEIMPTPIQVVRSNDESLRGGLAEWSIHGFEPGFQQITIRHQGETLVHPVIIGQRNYLPPRFTHSSNQSVTTEVRLKQYLPLGLPFGNQWLGLPPWMIGYIVLTLGLTPILKRLCHVA